MFVDFAVNNNGDLLFKEQDINSNIVKIAFNLSKTKVQKISFDFIDFQTATQSNSAVKIMFDISKRTANKVVEIRKDDESIQQLIKLKLKTTLGELPYRSKFGSKISLMKHKEINNANLKNLSSYIEECLSDIVVNPLVITEPYIDSKNGYKQTVMIKVFNNGNKIVDYIIER